MPTSTSEMPVWLVGALHAQRMAIQPAAVEALAWTEHAAVLCAPSYLADGADAFRYITRVNSHIVHSMWRYSVWRAAYAASSADARLTMLDTELIQRARATALLLGFEEKGGESWIPPAA